MSEKIRLTKESLEFYDPEVELREIDAKLALAGCE